MQNNNKKRFKKRYIFLIVLALLLVLFGVVYFKFSKAYNDTVYKEFDTITSDENKDVKIDKTKINFLILGMEHSRSDAIMVATYDTQIKRLDVMSLHRDTYVSSREGLYKDPALYKLNSLYSYPSEDDGVKRVAKEASSITGLPINEYIMVDYDAVAKIVDAVGGVDVDLPFAMNYDDVWSKPATHIHIPKGLNHLNGENAVKYLRWRQNNGGAHGQEGDVGRVKRQHEFMQKLLDKAIDPVILPKVIDVALKNVKTSVDFNSAVALGANAATMDKTNVHFYSQIGEATYFHSLSYFMSDKESNRALFQKAINDMTITEEDLKPSTNFLAEIKLKRSYNSTKTTKSQNNSSYYDDTTIKTNDVSGTTKNNSNNDVIFNNNPTNSAPTDEQINNSVTNGSPDSSNNSSNQDTPQTNTPQPDPTTVIAPETQEPAPTPAPVVTEPVPAPQPQDPPTNTEGSPIF